MEIYDTISSDAIQTISKATAYEHKIVPFNVTDKYIDIYCSKEATEFAEEQELLTGQSVNFNFVEEAQLDDLLGKFYPKNQDERAKVKVYDKEGDEFLDVLIEEAKELNSSDIHIEAYEEVGRVRIRIDGKLIERYQISPDLYPTLINKIKIKAHLDIAEKRLPQDGRIEYNDNGIKVDIRVSILPTLYGEKVVMRLLNNDATDIEISSLGFTQGELERYMEGVKQPNGILLISGPTGSGKTTTLYATLKLLNKKDTNVVTIEDPIEYTLEGINQVQLKEDIGLDFKAALKSFLRQDPDVIMLGEIRDAETANMAIRAALTGHLVLSTIHTNSAWGTISRLIDMGVPPFLISSTLSTSVAQRLVRKLCNSCKKEVNSEPKNLPKTYSPPFKIGKYYEAGGCEACHYTGYKGRQAVYEVIALDKELGELIKNGIFDASKELKEKQIKTLSENAYQMLANGLTTLEEVYPILINA